MSSDLFDDLARALAAPMPRKRALRLGLGAVAASVAAMLPGLTWGQPVQGCGRGGWFGCGLDCCPPGTSCCLGGSGPTGHNLAVCCAPSQVCMSPVGGGKVCCDSGPGHGHVCPRPDGFEQCCAFEYPCCSSDPFGCCLNPNQICDPRRGCVEACDPPCEPGSTCCGGACCHNRSQNESCVDGQCVPCDPPCTSFDICCGGTCVHMLADPANCGDCGNVCPSGLTCCNGQCLKCDLPLMCCNTAPIQMCVDTSTNPDHCGDCSTVCPPGQACQHGKCTGCTSDDDCDPNCERCDQSTSTCISICDNGGACCRGVCCCGACDQTLGVCLGETRGICEDSGAGEHCCGEICRQLKFDRLNCGACGRACGRGEDCCDGQCVDLYNDVNNCGVCFNQCSPDAVCQAGECLVP